MSRSPTQEDPARDSVSAMSEGPAVSRAFDISVDFMDMTDDRRLWARAADARPGVKPTVGSHVVVGDDDADPMVALVISADVDGNLELKVLQGSVDSHSDLLSQA